MQWHREIIVHRKFVPTCIRRSCHDRFLGRFLRTWIAATTQSWEAEFVTQILVSPIMHAFGVTAVVRRKHRDASSHSASALLSSPGTAMLDGELAMRPNTLSRPLNKPQLRQLQMPGLPPHHQSHCLGGHSHLAEAEICPCHVWPGCSPSAHPRSLCIRRDTIRAVFLVSGIDHHACQLPIRRVVAHNHHASGASCESRCRLPDRTPPTTPHRVSSATSPARALHHSCASVSRSMICGHCLVAGIKRSIDHMRPHQVFDELTVCGACQSSGTAPRRPLPPA